jgi:hypothetical protein
MTSDLAMLLLTAVSIGALHTLLGPDHYIPFVAMAKAGRWSVPKTAAVTAACGVGHVAGSILLGFIGVAFGVAVARLEWIESVRGNIAGWLLIAMVRPMPTSARTWPHPFMPIPPPAPRPPHPGCCSRFLSSARASH